jgi:hypothetical protein
MAEHTPETWKVEGSIYEHMAAEIVAVSPDGESGIAQVWKHPKAMDRARLIAAAPALVEAAMALLEQWRAYGGSDLSHYAAHNCLVKYNLWDDLDAALSAATQKQE